MHRPKLLRKANSSGTTAPTPKAARSVSKESIAAQEEAAKQLISITSLTQGIYFAATSFSDLKKTLVTHDLYGWLPVFLFASPIVLWLVSLTFAVRVFAPETHSTNLQSPDLAKEMLQEIVAFKHKQLKLAHKALLAGFVLLVANIIVYLRWIPQVAPK
jgi:hypothetical protein